MALTAARTAPRSAPPDAPAPAEVAGARRDEVALPPPAARATISPPSVPLARMVIFLALAALVAAVLRERIVQFFMANPALNALIVAVLATGIGLALAGVLRLRREARWAGAALRGEPSRVSPRLLAPLRGALTGGAVPEGAGREGLLDGLQGRLDDGREVLRYLTGLLVFLGLIGTFWGLLETIGSIGNVIASLRSGPEGGALLDELKTSLAAPLAGMGVSFSSSLFGLAGSLVLGFLDLQLGRAHARFAEEVEAALPVAPPAPLPGIPAGTVQGLAAAVAELRSVIAASNLLGREGASRAAPEPDSAKAAQASATQAMGNLADGIQALVRHMRGEQQMIRDWVEAQAARERRLEGLLERVAGEPGGRA